jgi:hypothetical protein
MILEAVPVMSPGPPIRQIATNRMSGDCAEALPTVSVELRGGLYALPDDTVTDAAFAEPSVRLLRSHSPSRWALV